MRRLLMDEIMNQVTLYGGLSMTRRSVVDLMQREGHGQACISYFAFHSDARIVPDGLEPWPADEAYVMFHGPEGERQKLLAREA